jgi:hypothetical protein
MNQAMPIYEGAFQRGIALDKTPLGHLTENGGLSGELQ